MIYMHQFIPKNAWPKLQQLQQWGQLRQEQMSQAYYITKDTVLQYLRHQIERGNWREVQDVLKGKPMTSTGKFLYYELRDRVIGKLIMRLGLRKIIAVGLAVILLPIILAQAAGELIKRVKR
ncbi:hypothetical protein [Pontibacter anaerobius]|uniref:Uncharacterized protein n=1 Tax=Pontibacter anaerobius TaxID=2993940 RepID=A0ABT3RD28_9BACT|nr:hypothetical protein [Pontibacter anaerobius]MCX2739267.1 hypothetical protein [Pontibacter anaerobius]